MRFSAITIGMTLCLLVLSESAYAYIGPGAGLSALGTIVAFIGAILLAVVGFVWYPVKRLMRKRTESRQEKPKPEDADQ